MDKRVDRLTIHMENQVVDKVRALFDGWTEHEEKFVDTVEKVDQIHLKFDRLELETDKLGISLEKGMAVQAGHSELLDLLAVRSIRQEADIQLLRKAR